MDTDQPSMGYNPHIMSVLAMFLIDLACLFLKRGRGQKSRLRANHNNAIHNFISVKKEYLSYTPYTPYTHIQAHSKHVYQLIDKDCGDDYWL